MKEYQKLICAVLVLSGGFVAGARADGETIAVFTKNQTNPFFQTVRVGADAAAGKATFVSILGADRARAQAELLINQAVAHLDLFEQRAELLREAARFVITRRT